MDGLDLKQPFEPIPWESQEKADGVIGGLKRLEQRQEEMRKQGCTIEEITAEMKARLSDIEKAYQDAQLPKEAREFDIPGGFKAAIAAAPEQQDLDYKRELSTFEKAVLLPVPEKATGGWDQVRDFQKLNDEMVFFGAWAQRMKARDAGFDIRKTKKWKTWQKACNGINKALDTETATEGTEWVPTLMSADFISLMDKSAGLHTMFRQVPLPGKTLDISRKSSRATMYRAPESTADSAAAYTLSTMGTTKTTFTAKKGQVSSLMSEEMSEDSAVAAIPIAMQDFMESILLGFDSVILNGDSTTPPTGHQDYVAGSSDVEAVVTELDIRTIQKGLRKLALASGSANCYTSLGGVDPYASNLLLGVGKMKEYGSGNPMTERFWITGYKGLIKLMGLLNASGGTPVVLTVDVFGPRAPIVTGQLLWLAGSPVLVSPVCWETLNASGVYDGSVKIHNQYHHCHRDGYGFAFRRQIRMRSSTELFMNTGQIYLQGDVRFDFEPMRGAPSATSIPNHYFYYGLTT